MDDRRDGPIAGETTDSAIAAGRDGPGPIRRLLMPLLLLGMVGLAAELVLLEHTEDTLQWVPLVALAVSFLLALAVAARPGRGVIRAFQAVMAACVVAGAVGFYLHMKGNIEFELESDPSLGGLELLVAALYGATPALAPGALAQLGLLGLVLTYRHPALGPRRG